jgi:2'-hydroxyisoflavone reductase
MKLLIVGGTAFVGRATAWSAWHHGHEITVLNRGMTPSDLPESIERLVGDRRCDLSALDGRSFDATIDVIAYRPSDVKRLATALGERGGHYIQISSISAYNEPAEPGATEATLTLMSDPADLEAPVDEFTYGPLKAASERAGTEYFGEGSTMVRPTYVIGSFDTTLRFPYWVERARRGGEIAVPGPPAVRRRTRPRQLRRARRRRDAARAVSRRGPDTARGFRRDDRSDRASDCSRRHIGIGREPR